MDVIHTIGRRKSSVARIYMKKGKGKILVNGKDFKEYFPVSTMQYKLEQPFKTIDMLGDFDVNVSVNGGGISGQPMIQQPQMETPLLAANEALGGSFGSAF